MIWYAVIWRTPLLEFLQLSGMAIGDLAKENTYLKSTFFPYSFILYTLSP